MGFDVLYLPPIHPIGFTLPEGPGQYTRSRARTTPAAPGRSALRKGGTPRSTPSSERPRTSSSSWERREPTAWRSRSTTRSNARRTIPGWLSTLNGSTTAPTGRIACAENPPKIYQDIYPLNFWPTDEDDRVALWEACRDVLEYWISFGVKIFRVDNPHTKPMAFWEWVLADVKARHPEVMFLAEAFTRPEGHGPTGRSRVHPELHLFHLADRATRTGGPVGLLR